VPGKTKEKDPRSKRRKHSREWERCKDEQAARFKKEISRPEARLNPRLGREKWKKGFRVDCKRGAGLGKKEKKG